MLILSRNPGESIILGAEGDVKIHVLVVKGNQVRIGIEAPRDMPVHREEIYERIRQELGE